MNSQQLKFSSLTAFNSLVKWLKQSMMQFKVLYFLIVITHLYGYQTDTLSTKIPKEPLVDHGNQINVGQPRLMYVKYGSYCGECAVNCTKMYTHHLIGNISTFWTDHTDSYFSKTGLKCATRMNDASQNISMAFIEQIPTSIFSTGTTQNIYGCPDCDDGCGLYFEYLLDSTDAKPVKFFMEYSLHNNSGDIKELGKAIKQTLQQLEKYR